VAGAIALTLVVGSTVAGVAVADDHTMPTRREVHQARAAVHDKAADVESVRARLVLANQRLEASAQRAAQAAEAYNGARWELQQARAQARDAQQRSEIAAADVERQRAVYGQAMVTSYEMAPGLTALSAIARSNGIQTVIERTTSMQNAESALDGHYDEFRAAATIADVATKQAEDARATATEAAQKARDARDAAQAAADQAAAESQSIAQEKAQLIRELADLQHVSVHLAARRQAALEAKAAAAAAAAAQHQAELAAQKEAQHQAHLAHLAQLQQQQQAQQQQQQAQQQAQQHPHHHAAPAPSQPSAPPPPPPAPPAPPAPASGAPAAIAFARAQLGEPYSWGAAGPDAWDCSGLTMGAWGAGGRSLPHYSVAQYQQSTPISAGSLQPGDLVFWGSSSDPSSIFHVALYIGDGQIIHAPRTGEPVQVASMYYWTPPNFFARP
jgi:cell wall-associated NlpC family hydrolase